MMPVNTVLRSVSDLAVGGWGATRRGMLRIVSWALMASLVCAPWGTVRAQGDGVIPAWSAIERPGNVTAKAWSATEGGAAVELLVALQAQFPVEEALLSDAGEPRGQAISQGLWRTAQSTQLPLRAWLQDQGVPYRAFYIVNALLIHGDRNLLLALARRPEVDRIMTNPRVAADLGSSSAPASVVPAATTSIEWGVQRIGAPQVWAMGFHGEGVVVAGQDTGYQWDHPALKSQYRGWDGASANHDYNWHDAIHTIGGDCPPNGAVPCDDTSHGTHTMGTIVGDDGVDRQIGVAPGAEWIGCRNMQEGFGTPASYIECFEFFLAPYPVGGDTTQRDPSKAPNVINNSWSCPPFEGCDEDHIALLEQTVEAVRAAGIMVVASAGNKGAMFPYCGTVSDPPGMYDATYTIGATDGFDSIADFSSRGTTSGLIKPDITAPGVGVYSSIPTDTYGPKQGTSMASPHVAGAVALLWSARPDLVGQVDTTEFLLNTTAVTRTSTQCGDAADAIPNNVYGWGRLSVLDAVRSALTGAIAGTVRDQEGTLLGNVSIQAASDWDETWQTQSSALGSYALMPLSGTYTVTASLNGYGSAHYASIQVAAGLTTTLDVELNALIPRQYLPLIFR